MKVLSRIFVTGLGLGYIPGAPGTCGSLPGIALFLLTCRWPLIWQLLLLLTVFLAGVIAAASAEREWGEDPGRCVIDEVVGQWVTLLIAGATGWWWLLAGFLMFRLLDIVKPGIIDRSQRLGGGWGVMVDDLLAGLAGGLILLLARILLG